MLKPFLLVVAAALVTSSCAGAGTTAPGAMPTPSPTPSQVCVALVPVDPTLALVSPAKGATGVPVTIGRVTFSATFISYDVLTLTPSDNSGVVNGGPINASNGTDVSTIPVLRSGVTYDVKVHNTNGIAACGNTILDLGTFTTQ